MRVLNLMGGSARARRPARRHAGGLHAEPVAGTAAEALSRTAHEAVRLIDGRDVERVKECEHPDCSLPFLDETQAGRRRWCSLERCGKPGQDGGVPGAPQVSTGRIALLRRGGGPAEGGEQGVEIPPAFLPALDDAELRSRDARFGA